MTANLKILVIDDSPTMRRIIIDSLGKIGYTNVTEARDGRNALEIIRKEPFGLIITDWNMPEINGLALTGLLKRSHDFRDIPILMISTRSMQDDIVAAIRAGVGAYIVKPFSPETLKEKIDQVLGDL